LRARLRTARSWRGSSTTSSGSSGSKSST
jgi:hypothetical protein